MKVIKKLIGSIMIIMLGLFGVYLIEDVLGILHTIYVIVGIAALVGYITMAVILITDE